MKSIPDLFKEMWEVFKGNWKSFLVIGILSLIVMILVTTILGSLIGAELLMSMTKIKNVQALSLFITQHKVVLLQFLILLFMLFLVETFFVGAIYYQIKDKEKSYFSALNNAYHNFWRLLGAAFLQSLIVCLGIIFFIIPGIYLGVLLAFVLPIAVFEDKGAALSLMSSISLLKNHWWATLFRLLAFGCLYFLVSLGLNALMLGGLSYFIGLVFQPIYTFCLYKNLKEI